MSETLKNLFEKTAGETLAEQIPLTASGSNRKYYRLKSANSALIGVEGTSKEENRAFSYMAKKFKTKGLPVPEFKAMSNDEMRYLQEDLGDTLLFDYLKRSRMTGVFSAEEKVMLNKVMEILPLFQIKGAMDFDFSYCYPQPEFDRRTILWDLNYFKYCFLKATGVDFQENLLENDFDKMADFLLQSATDTFMYRDFQSRNIMIKDGEPYFIDFQGGRKGPLYYDVASFVWQAKAQYGKELRDEMIAAYLNSLKKHIAVDETEFHHNLKHFVLFRLLQVLGAYGFRGYFEKKPHFLQSIPYALQNLRELMKDDFPEYPYMMQVLREMADMKQFQDLNLKKPLVVTIYSFAYKKGIPNDDSGNGGGFVFDCRAVNNPGKYEKYASLTGLDEPVIEFLEKDGEILKFLESVYALTDASVKRYMDRSFTNLMICFGCTGGRHRSVYSAQKVADRISKKFGVEVHLVHREQNLEQDFKAVTK